MNTEDINPRELTKPKDKDLVWTWNDRHQFRRSVRFYDGKNNCVFILHKRLAPKTDTVSIIMK